ncbi:MAG: hypothetical protein CTY31_05010 [Hyphomicrobium sp.]|nr:MAG: hypothetical protein CTY39_10725 [Hyphomicrobium sp.]PPD00480.1 MAG: hypothetical protein CTY31_05010 [Hyphomicrobium sp.]
MSRTDEAGDQNDKPWRHGAACVIVHFRLTPKSSKESIDGLLTSAEGSAFQARVRAPPEDGAANAALERLAAEWLQVPKRSVQLLTGAKSRLKSLKIVGDPDALDKLLQRKLHEFVGIDDGTINDEAERD